MVTFLLLTLLGCVVGGFGTLIGVGGGFVLVPILLWLNPDSPAETITSISLAVVFFNALSGTIAYARKKRIHFKSGLAFSLAALPGTILGALATAYIPRRMFDFIIGALLMLVAAYLLLRPRPKVGLEDTISRRSGKIIVAHTDGNGKLHEFSYNLWLGLALSIVVGFLSSMLGIGGGIIHVPALIHLLNFPVHLATATSHFILSLMAFTGSATHYLDGSMVGTFAEILPLGLGAVIGAQIGARLSDRIGGTAIVRALAVALFFVALRTIWQVWW